MESIQQENKLKKLLNWSLAWNTFEAFSYQIVFFGHQAALFFVLERSQLGLIGSIFALAYFGITFFNFGIETGIVPFFKELSSNKENFRFLLLYVIRQTLFLLLCPLAIAVLFFFCSSLLPQAFSPLFSFYWIALLSIFIASEGTKKNLRAVLHLAFQNKTTACVELANIIFYTSLVWGSYLAGIELTPLVLVTIFIGVSLLTNCVLLYLLYHYYQKLPKGLLHIPRNFYSAVFKNRGYLYCNQVSRSLFSGNFLLPFFACQAGLAQAGVASFINTVTLSFSFFIQKIFGPSGAALFASTKNFSFDTKHKAFKYLNIKCLQAAGILGFFVLVSTPSFLNTKMVQNSLQIWMIVFIFFLAHFLENLFIVYEKYFAAEQKAHYMAFFNGISFIGCIISAYWLSSFSLLATIISFLFLRLAAFYGIARYSQIKN